MFKNARRSLVDGGRFEEGRAPSYFLACLLYNVPDNLFLSDRQATMVGVLDWLVKGFNYWYAFRCQNGVIPLFGKTEQQ